MEQGEAPNAAYFISLFIITNPPSFPSPRARATNLALGFGSASSSPPSFRAATPETIQSRSQSREACPACRVGLRLPRFVNLGTNHESLLVTDTYLDLSVALKKQAPLAVLHCSWCGAHSHVATLRSLVEIKVNNVFHPILCSRTKKAMTTEMRSFYTPPTTAHASPHSPPIVDELISKYSSSMTHSASYRSTKSLGRSRNLVQRCIDHICLQYYRYEVTFGVYVMTPGEKCVANAFVLVFLSLLIWASLLYFPQLLFRKIGRMVWLLTGHSEYDQSYISPATASAIPTSFMAS
ncbi:hypothetical protein EYB25_000025 [Talaromyces marneffei]|nr:hypothetical protein EYB25_000025 [Talaromyces marneffei]